MKHWGVVAGLVLAALVIVALEFGLPWWQARQSADAIVPEAAVELDEPTPIEPGESVRTVVEPRPIPPSLPPLDESDPAVTQSLSDWPVESEWLGQGDLLRRLAALLDNAALGEVPRKQLAFLTPDQGFAVANVDGDLMMSPRNFARFDGYLDLLEAYPAEQSAAFLVLYAPLLDAALRELGRPDADSLALVVRAAANVQAVSIPEGGLALERTERGYKYADENVEAAPELDKQLLRLGPDNLARLQRYSRELVGQLTRAARPVSG